MKTLIAVAAVLLLSACTPQQSENVATAMATQHCASEGKQFVYADTASAPSNIPLVTNVTVTGYCK